METHTLEELARATGLTLIGNGSLAVARAAAPSDAGAGDLAIAMSDSYAAALRASAARAAVIWEGAAPADFDLDGALVATTRPRVALALITECFRPRDTRPESIHPTAVIDSSATLGPGSIVGPLAVIGARARVGSGARIGAHVSIGDDAEIGSDALLHDGTRIGAGCRIGDRFIAQPAAVIGADGFSFEPPERGVAETARYAGGLPARSGGGYLRIHSLGGVEIGDDVEIGSASVIDRGTLAPTRIGSGTKIDNQVQVGHNVQIGEACLLCAQVGIAGSSEIGDHVVLGGRVGVADHVQIGSDVICAAGTLVARNVPDRSIMMGAPATSRKRALRQIMAMKRLPRLFQQVEEIRKTLGL